MLRISETVKEELARITIMVVKEENIEVVLWGLGTNGKNLIDVLEKGTIVAIIDTNPEFLKLKSYQHIPIIDFNTYLNKYREYFIIVTPMICDSIIKSLKEQFVSEYFLQKESCIVLSAFLLVKNNMFIDLYKLDINKNYFIDGDDFFSLYLLKYLIKNKYKVELFYTNQKQKLMLEMLCEKNIIKSYVNIKKVGKSDCIIQMHENSFRYDGYFNVLTYKTINEKFYLDWKKDLIKFKDSQIGKRVFIIATGPSLKINDLEVLQNNNELTMSMNRIYNAFNDTSWRPNYYVISDGVGIRDYENLEEKDEWFANTEKFFSDNYLGFWNNQIDGTYHCFRQVQNSTKVEFSSDISDIIYSGLTVVYSCLQLAVYMGFKEIFLLGCDFSFSPKFDSDKDHFYSASKSVSKGMYSFNYEFVQKAYEKAKEYSELHGICIYNATRGGKLEVFKRVTFDDLF